MSDPSRIGCEFLREKLEESRLTISVATDHSDTVALIKTDGDLIEYGLGGKLETYGFRT
jgi:hypothetical protein